MIDSFSLADMMYLYMQTLRFVDTR